MSLDSYAGKLKKGDKQAFEQLYENMRGLVYTVSLSIVRNHGVAEEVMQDTFVAVWTKIDDFQGKGFKTWILMIARNKSINVLKKRQREVATDFTLNDSVGGSYTIDSLDVGITVKTALKKLNEEDRQIVLLKNSGMKMKEIAEYLNIPRGTASWRYSEALKSLRKFLEEET